MTGCIIYFPVCLEHIPPVLSVQTPLTWQPSPSLPHRCTNWCQIIIKQKLYRRMVAMSTDTETDIFISSTKCPHILDANEWMKV